LAKVKTQKEVEDLYGQLEALEQNMEVLIPSGPSLQNVMPHKIIIDPHAEQPDGMDAQWMIEEVSIPTAALIARFTKKLADDDGDDSELAKGKKFRRGLVYKPTHEAVFAQDAGARDDGLGMVLKMIDGGAAMLGGECGVDDVRKAYINMYHTQCYLVWDKATRRIMLFHKDDWTWPIWVWDDPLLITRFFPYFVIGFSMSTGGTICVGETAYYLDQQDEINEINRQVGRIRRTLFNYFYYNADNVTKDEAEKFVRGLRGDGVDQLNILGVRAGERPIKDMIEAFVPPAIEHEAFFNKEPTIQAINRITNTSDALRGVQFKTNTNEAAVNTYQDALRLSIGAKVDIVEDAVSDLALAVAEVAVQKYDQQMVEDLVGKELAKGWKNMTVQQFRTSYSVNIVSGSMEKPNSVFKKKEAVEIAQAVGQFATAAPGATLKVMLRVLEQAFTEVSIKPEDWDTIDAEIAAKAQAEAAQPPGAGGQAGGPQGQGQPPAEDAIMQQAMNLPPEVKARIMAMQKQGASPQELLQFIQQQVQQGQGAQNGTARPEPATH